MITVRQLQEYLNKFGGDTEISVEIPRGSITGLEFTFLPSEDRIALRPVSKGDSFLLPVAGK